MKQNNHPDQTAFDFGGSSRSATPTTFATCRDVWGLSHALTAYGQMACGLVGPTNSNRGGVVECRECLEYM